MQLSLICLTFNFSSWSFFLARSLWAIKEGGLFSLLLGPGLKNKTIKGKYVLISLQTFFKSIIIYYILLHI